MEENQVTSEVQKKFLIVKARHGVLAGKRIKQAEKFLAKGKINRVTSILSSIEDDLSGRYKVADLEREWGKQGAQKKIGNFPFPLVHSRTIFFNYNGMWRCFVCSATIPQASTNGKLRGFFIGNRHIGYCCISHRENNLLITRKIKMSMGEVPVSEFTPNELAFSQSNFVSRRSSAPPPPMPAASDGDTYEDDVRISSSGLRYNRYNGREVDGGCTCGECYVNDDYNDDYDDGDDDY